jgi:hypothetical protein
VSFESDFYSTIAVAGVTTLVGTEIWPSHASEGASSPYITYTTVYDEPFYSIDGESNVTRVRVQVDCYSEDVDQAASISRAVINSIPESGTLCRVRHTNQDMGLETETRLFRRMVEFTIFYRS